MGMFDEIDYECTCPVCHGKVEGFQSKDGDRALDHLKPTEVSNFYTNCRKCGCWIQFDKEGDKYKRTVSKYEKSGYRKKAGRHVELKEHTKLVNING